MATKDKYVNIARRGNNKRPRGYMAAASTGKLIAAINILSSTLNEVQTNLSAKSRNDEVVNFSNRIRALEEKLDCLGEQTSPRKGPSAFTVILAAAPAFTAFALVYTGFDQMNIMNKQLGSMVVQTTATQSDARAEWQDAIQTKASVKAANGYLARYDRDTPDFLKNAAKSAKEAEASAKEAKKSNQLTLLTFSVSNSLAQKALAQDVASAKAATSQSETEENLLRDSERPSFAIMGARLVSINSNGNSVNFQAGLPCQAQIEYTISGQTGAYIDSMNLGLTFRTPFGSTTPTISKIPTGSWEGPGEHHTISVRGQQVDQEMFNQISQGQCKLECFLRVDYRSAREHLLFGIGEIYDPSLSVQMGQAVLSLDDDRNYSYFIASKLKS